MAEVALETRYQSGADQTSAAEKKYQAAKYADIIEILLSAGYFRARINGLSEFDKVSSPQKALRTTCVFYRILNILLC